VADSQRRLPIDDETKRHERALDRFKLASQAEDAQRQREVEDLRFIDFDDQWPGDVRSARDGINNSGNGLPAVPARPCLTINKLLQPVEIVSTQARQARLALQFSPKTSGADQDTAEAFEDIVRAVQANSRAHLARQWAFERAVKAGRGFYRILTEYANDGDNDLDIVYKRILNQSSVYLDPSAQEPDWSDGLWAFVTEDLPLSRYKALYPKSEMAQSDLDTLNGVGNDQPDWCKDHADGKLIRVAEYWEVVLESVEVTLYAFPDGTEKNCSAEEHAFAQKAGGQPVINEATGEPFVRDVERRRVRWTKINAIEVLDQQDWPGRYIPIIPVIGRESNVNGERRWTGIVRPARDSQRLYNYMVSNEAEMVGLAPRAPYIGYWETIEPFQEWWKQANTRNFPFLPVAPARDGSGQVLPPPQRNTVEPAIQATAMAIAQANSDIQATTTVHDPSLGNLSPNERSGKAIMALQKQSEQSTGQYLDNLAQMSMLYEGKVLRDLIPKVYTRVGRIVATVGEDDQQGQVMLGKPFTTQKGQPVPAQPGDPKAKTIDLAKGEYGVAVTIGKSFTTRREEGVAQMGQLAEAAPQLVQAYADVWVSNMDFPGAKQIADRLKKSLPPQLQEGEDGEPSVEQLMQKLQEQGQMLEMMTKELEGKTRVIETDQVKAQQSLAETDLKARAAAQTDAAKIESDNQREAARIDADKQIAALKALVELAKAEIAAQTSMASQHAEMAREELGFKHEHAEGERERAAQSTEQARDRAVSMVEGERGREFEGQEAERDRQVSAEEAEAARGFEAEQAERTRQAEMAAQESDGA